jgi:uroporphyrinogen-III decarboxylase
MAIKETMTPMERLDAAVNLQPVDRVPICPMMDFFCARQEGMLISEYINSDKLWEMAYERTFEKMGGWDVVFSAGKLEPILFSHGFPVRMKLPGRELPDDEMWQFDEVELMKVDEYDTVIEKGWEKYFWNVYLPRFVPGKRAGFLGQLTTIPHLIKAERVQIKEVKKWASRGHPVLMPAAIGHPFELLSAARSMHQFALDMFRRPDKVKAALKAITPDIITLGIRKAKNTGIPRIMMGATRGSGSFISPAQFEEFYLEELLRMTAAFNAEGIMPLLHHDSNWEPMLPYFKELPARSAILELDGHTDMFKAKEILGDHLCLMGDVPASLLTLGTPEETSEYVKKLIDGVGKGGGFILSSGCDIPIDAKRENVQAMVDTGKSYYPH